MAALLLRSAWPKYTDFCEKWHFSCLNRTHIGIFSSISEISALKLTPVPNFSKIRQKIKELEFRP